MFFVRPASFLDMRSVVLALLAMVSPVRAERDTFVGVSGLLGSEHRLTTVGLSLEVGRRIPGTPLWARASVTRAVLDQSLFLPTEEPLTGTTNRGSAGVEARTCAIRLCAFFDGEVGYYSEEVGRSYSKQTPYYGTMLAERVGLDVGGDSVRFRAAFGLLQLYRQRSINRSELETVGELTMGLAARF